MPWFPALTYFFFRFSINDLLPEQSDPINFSIVPFDFSLSQRISLYTDVPDTIQRSVKVYLCFLQQADLIIAQV
jgi:hypothetical protein